MKVHGTQAIFTVVVKASSATMEHRTKCLHQHLVPCNDDAHTFLFTLEKVDSIPFTGWTLQCTMPVGGDRAVLRDCADRNLGSLRILHVQCLLSVA